ncbi:uncharacterized protein UV8b_05090 [Ustilaginoidea virens]|uniref:Uncharacterized protein n=1 Tax=Ustilaginoidea virens TaxID=1159556 RepID=A0A8E5HTD0_USTVR|nr:uncharacterized protein UV8b_05090 [Ustilaginoidea virens]QUC20849.1 hypothetical protein UV8b_05090 [Ustilaginoidea virens]
MVGALKSPPFAISASIRATSTMCRLLVFSGSFGCCESGIFVEQHEFDQECDRCTEEDEGIGDVGDETHPTPEKRGAETEEPQGQRKKQRV